MPFIQNRSAFRGDRKDDGFDYADNGHVEEPSTSAEDLHVLAPQTSDSASDPLAAALLGLADVSARLLVTHPCTVLRRQCQVHQHARSLHLTPFTLVPVVFNIAGKEGISSLWKGTIGTCVVWGMSSITETVLADLLGFPKSFVVHGSTEKYWRHIFLKAATFFSMTPFLVSSFTETVRSVSGLGGDDSRIFDVIFKGIDRMRFAVFNARDASRRFSVLQLAIPTVTYRTVHYMIESALYHQFLLVGKRYVGKKSERERSRYHQFVPTIFARLSSTVLTDLLLFPFETVLHRMYIQGTRTLIDNLDTGVGAASITIKYSGFFDCMRSIIHHEGFSALYSGVGALAIQYLFHFALHQLIRACFDRGSEVLRKATAQHRIATPPLSTNTSFNAPLAGPLSGSFSSQLTPPLTSPIKQNIASPPRDPTQFPTFGESAAQFDTGYAAPPFPYQGNRPNVFGSPPARSYDRGRMGNGLNNDRMDDPFSG